MADTQVTQVDEVAQARAQMSGLKGVTIYEAGSAAHQAETKKRDTKPRQAKYDAITKAGGVGGMPADQVIQNIETLNQNGIPVRVNAGGVNYLFQPKAKEKEQQQENAAAAQAQAEKKTDPWSIAAFVAALAALGIAIWSLCKKGRKGKDGKDGKKGDKGDPGQNGQDGKPGENGKDGETKIVTEVKYEHCPHCSEIHDPVTTPGGGNNYNMDDDNNSGSGSGGNSGDGGNSSGGASSALFEAGKQVGENLDTDGLNGLTFGTGSQFHMGNVSR